MKKLFFVVAFAAISFSSVYAYPVCTTKSITRQDTTKKKKPYPDTTKKKKKDTTQVKKVVG